MKLVVADVTKAVEGSLGSLFHGIEAAYPPDEFEVDVICLEEQLGDVRTWHRADEPRIVRNPRMLQLNARHTIREAIEEFFSDDAAESAIVHSFHGTVFSVAHWVPEDLLSRVEVLRWAEATQRKPRPPRANASPGGWPAELPPIETAAQLLAASLADLSVPPTTEDRAIRKTDMRAFLTRADPVFTKGRSAAASTPGLITMVLDEAERSGLMRAVGHHRTNPAYVVTELGLRVDRPAQSVRRVRRPTTHLSSGAPVRPEALQSLLSGCGLGPFPGLRPHLYDAVMAEYDRTDEAQPLAVLLARAVARVHNSPSPELAGPDELPSPDVLYHFLVELFRRAAVLEDGDGEAIDCLRTDALTPVASISVDWRNALEDVLVEALDRQTPLRLHDVVAVSLALHGSTAPAHIEAVAERLSRLAPLGEE